MKYFIERLRASLLKCKKTGFLILYFSDRIVYDFLNLEMINLITLFKQLVNHLGYVIVIAFFISRLKTFKKIIRKTKINTGELIILSILFGGFGILGTYIGIDVRGAIANTRNIGVIVGGILGGPLVGIISGLIAGIHRIAIDIGGITAIPCAIATFFGGYISGVIYKKSDRNNRWFYGLIGGIVVENLSMGLILLMSKPFYVALSIVKEIYIPMVLVNGIGIAIVIIITENIFEVKEEIAARQAKLALEIANDTLPYFREETKESMHKICEIIKDSVEADAVSITNTNHVLAHVGSGEDQIINGKGIMTGATEKVINEGKVYILNDSSEINCLEHNYPLKSAVIVPLKEKDKVVGTLKIYYERENAVTYRDKILAEGLSHLISTQLEISKLEKIKDMASKAEIKALQAQINPHFLFNALNTIVSFVRIDPNKARDLIIDLSTYLRYNLEKGDELVNIESELNQVKAYVKIEQARYGEKLNVIYDVDEDIDIKIPSLIIQPLVENSIRHGILKDGDGGTVKVSIKKDNGGGTAQITIEDDGIGIDPEVIISIYKGTVKGNKIGLANVHNRLKILYGKGLDIKRLTKGTRISFEVYNKK